MPLKTAIRLAALLGALSLLSGCYSTAFNYEASHGLDLAKELHSIPMPGFTYSKISEPQLGFDYNNPNSGFSAKPEAGELTADGCQTVVDWVQANLTDVSIELQYVRGTSGQELLACRTAAAGLLRNSMPGLAYTGLYKKNPVFVMYSGAADGTFDLVVSGAPSGADDFTGGNSDLGNDVQKLLNAMAEYRAKNAVGDFSEQQLTDFWDGYKQQTGSMAKMGWTADSDGKVRTVVLNDIAGLLPFCMYVGPVNPDVVGPDLGPDYLFVLGDSLDGPVSFGFATSDCKEAQVPLEG